MILILNFFIFFLLITGFIFLEKKQVSRNNRILLAIFFGGMIGILMQTFLQGEELENALSMYIIVGSSYLRFLQMLIFPVVATGILLAFTHISEKDKALKSAILIVGILLLTTAISVIVAFFTTSLFKLDFSNFVGLIPHSDTLEKINNRSTLLSKPFYQMITEFIPTNPFLDLTGARQNSLASIVVFFSFIGFAYLKIKSDSPNLAKSFNTGVDIANKLMMNLVSLALKFTPFGILGLFTKLTASISLVEISQLFIFIISSYFAIFVMFLVHGIMVGLAGVNPFSYYKKVSEVLLFSFFSRSSSAALPLNIETQVQKLGLSNRNATISSSLGVTIGQNGCAGIYPAMLVTMIAPSVGIDIFNISFVLTLVLILTINSFGIAGVGGGALFAGIVALNAFNMPIAIIAVLAGIEPIIDMARTALNVNGSIVSSLIASKLNKDDKEIS